jgi:hypothetical protein
MAQVSYVFNSHVEPAILNLEERNQTSRTSRVRVQQRRFVAAAAQEVKQQKQGPLSLSMKQIGSIPK